MKKLIILMASLFISTLAFAGTGSGCSGDQWSSGEGYFVYRTGNLWEIGAPGEQNRGCGLVSARSSSKRGVFMANKICSFSFNANSSQLTVKSQKGKNCSCEGTVTLEKDCSE